MKLDKAIQEAFFDAKKKTKYSKSYTEMFLNPSKKEFVDIAKKFPVRTVVTNKDVYIIDSYGAIHDDILDWLVEKDLITDKYTYGSSRLWNETQASLSEFLCLMVEEGGLADQSESYSFVVKGPKLEKFRKVIEKKCPYMRLP